MYYCFRRLRNFKKNLNTLLLGLNTHSFLFRVSLIKLMFAVPCNIKLSRPSLGSKDKAILVLRFLSSLYDIRMPCHIQYHTVLIAYLTNVRTVLSYCTPYESSIRILHILLQLTQ